MATPVGLPAPTLPAPQKEEEITPYTICRKFTLDQLLRLCQLEKVKVNMEDNASAERVFEILVEAVVRALKDNGIRSFTNLLTLPLLQAMAARDEPDELNKAKKPVLQKRIREMSLQMGVSKYLQSLNLPIPTLAEIIPLLSGGIYTYNPIEMCDQIEVLTNIIGMQSILQKCDLPFLRQVCNQMHLKSPDNKLQLIAVISTQSSVLTEAPPPPPKLRKPTPQPQTVTFSAVKLPISSSSKFQDIFQHYYQPELVQWCRDHGLKSTGSKPKLIHRILEFFHGSSEMGSNNASGEKQDSDTDEESNQQQQQQEIQYQHAQPAEIISMQIDPQQSIPAAVVHHPVHNNNNNNNNSINNNNNINSHSTTTTTTTTSSSTSNNNHQRAQPIQQQQQPQQIHHAPPPQQHEIQMSEAIEPPSKKARIATQDDVKALEDHRRKLLARRKEIMDYLKRLDEIQQQ